VDVAVAISTERDQIFVCVVTQPAPRAHVVDLETIGTAAVLASPAVTLQHFLFCGFCGANARSTLQFCGLTN
jgi:hypothetical protein